MLDADVYGPSVPLMLNFPDALEEEGGMVVPQEKFGLRIVSMGKTAGQNEAFIWRWPLIAKMILPLLGAVPVDLDLGRRGENGIPLMVSAPDSEIGRIFQKVAQEFTKKVASPTSQGFQGGESSRHKRGLLELLPKT